MNSPGVTIVIPVWNGRELLLSLLEKLRAQTYTIAEILAVDNGSQDGAAEAAEQQGARVLRLGSNRGFSSAVNHGVEACRTELVALVNSDVEPEPELSRNFSPMMLAVQFTPATPVPLLPVPPMVPLTWVP